jgi:hypothetical protein
MSNRIPAATDDHTDEVPAPGSDPEWRLRWYVGDLAHHTAWTADFATVENLYDQYRRSEVFAGHDIVIERRGVVRGRGERKRERARRSHDIAGEAGR